VGAVGRGLEMIDEAELALAARSGRDQPAARFGGAARRPPPRRPRWRCVPSCAGPPATRSRGRTGDHSAASAPATRAATAAPAPGRSSRRKPDRAEPPSGSRRCRRACDASLGESINRAAGGPVDLRDLTAVPPIRTLARGASKGARRSRHVGPARFTACP
jgi:hypothetical protein